MKRSPQFHAARIARSRAIFRTIQRIQVAEAAALNKTMHEIRSNGGMSIAPAQPQGAQR